MWGLSLATLRWEAMPTLLCARSHHACCTVRGALVVLGGTAPGGGNDRHTSPTSRVEMLLEGAGAFVKLPRLSCGAIAGAAAFAVDEEDSAQGQVFLIGGAGHDGASISSVQLVDLATGVCTLQADLLHERSYFAAARSPDGGIACAGDADELSTAVMYHPQCRGRWVRHGRGGSCPP